MQLSALQYDCLAKMGIEVFEKRSFTFSYGIVVDLPNSIISPDEEQLLNKILLALNWPSDQVERSYLPNVIEKLKQLAPTNKAIVFSDRVDQRYLIKEGFGVTVIALPSLKALQNNIEAKRLAWKAMQPLIVTNN